MKTLHVGGKQFFNRFSSLEAALKRAEHDDIIELHRDEKEVSLYISKNITINGNGHLIIPENGKTALDCASFVTLHDIRFACPSRTNGIVIRNGGNLSGIKTEITGPVRMLCPTVIQRGGILQLTDSEIMYMETYRGHGSAKTITFLKNCQIRNYYGGFAWLNDRDYSLSKFRGVTTISDSELTCTVLEGKCRLDHTVFHNFNKAAGNVTLESCELKAAGGDVVRYPGEPSDGPLKDWNPKVIPYALHIVSGNVTAENFSSCMNRDCIGFYMTDGSLKICSVNSRNDQARHLLKGGTVMFDDVLDDGFYEIKKARCGIVRSRVNTSSDTGSAMEQLNAMIGLNSVKRQLHTIMNTIRVNMEYPEKDFGFSSHMVFAGDPGTGKTTVAKLVAQALFEIGAIPENRCMEVPASQLIRGYVGQTGGHVETILKKALGGVLFIDEAYELMVKDNQNTFNNDALAVLLRYMEDHRHELVVITAGYEKEMKEFLASNIGLTRRFQWISFEDYTPEEMTEMFLLMSKKYQESFAFEDPKICLTDSFRQLTGFYRTHPDAKGRTTNGGNGGLVRNLFQQVVFARNNRITEYPESTMKLIREDIRNGMKEELKKALNVSYGTVSL